MTLYLFEEPEPVRPQPKPRIAPAEAVHVVPVGQPKARVYQALCGEFIHAGEMKQRASGEPTCPTCKRLNA